MSNSSLAPFHLFSFSIFPWKVLCFCLLQGCNLPPFRFFTLCSLPSHFSYPLNFSSLNISFPLPTWCVYTHTQLDTLSPLDISFSSLIPCFSYQMDKPNMLQEQLVLMIWKYYKSSHCIFTKRDPEDGVFSTDHKGFFSLKIHNAVLLPALSLKVGQLLPGWLKTSFSRNTIPRCIHLWHKCRSAPCFITKWGYKVVIQEMFT